MVNGKVYTRHERNTFDPTTVVKSQGLKQILALHKINKLIDIMPSIPVSYGAGRDAMQSCQKYFSDRGIPWAVTEKRIKTPKREKAEFYVRHVLWKELMAE